MDLRELARNAGELKRLQLYSSTRSVDDSGNADGVAAQSPYGGMKTLSLLPRTPRPQWQWLAVQRRNWLRSSLRSCLKRYRLLPASQPSSDSQGDLWVRMSLSKLRTVGLTRRLFSLMATT